jgi:CHRD domain
MTKMRLTAFPVIIIAFIITLASCRRDDVEHQNLYMKTGIVMSGAQEVPSNSSSAKGNLNISYSRLSKTLSYNFSWTGLTGPVSVFHIHGLAPVGFSAPVFQTFTAASIVPCKVNGVNGPTTCGSYSGTLFVDGVAIKEADLLNGMYYVNIHTATYGGGEIKGQIKFQ